ncbi:hypothetical protein [Singulisphaera sp. PoT]|uniref:hypothetical protein n=1 Tax=Singulisphaera sp. PoT TaxID=3411797 RepID=UPI003BF5C8DC
MPSSTFACARCATGNHISSRFCVVCGLPLGAAMPDVDAGSDALGPYEAPEPADPDVTRIIREIVARSGYEAGPSSHGWRIVVPLQLDRKQAVYLGHASTDREGRSILSLVSVCGPANDRDARILLKHNARSVEWHFAIKVLRGEEYFVVIQNLASDTIAAFDPMSIVRRIAEAADSLEDRLSRGLDIY